MTERFGRIEFKTVSQVERFRTLGTALYQRLPNPLFRGWRPIDVENPPKLPDEIPRRDKDIPNDRKQIEMIMNLFGGREKVKERIIKKFGDAVPELANMLNEADDPKTAPMENVGRNKPCPCGSGKKYKMCCGRVKKRK